MFLKLMNIFQLIFLIVYEEGLGQTRLLRAGDDGDVGAAGGILRTRDIHSRTGGH